MPLGGCARLTTDSPAGDPVCLISTRHLYRWELGEDRSLGDPLYLDGGELGEYPSDALRRRDDAQEEDLALLDSLLEQRLCMRGGEFTLKWQRGAWDDRDDAQEEDTSLLDFLPGQYMTPRSR